MNKRPLIFLAYWILLFLFFETTARIVLLHTPILNRNRVETDSWYRLDIIRDPDDQKHKWQFSGCYGYDALLGWKLKPNCTNAAMFPGLIVHTNAQGLRGIVDYNLIKSPDKKRIAIIGDSFTFGHDAGDDQTYPYILQQHLTQTEIMNFGVSGYGLDQILLSLKQKVSLYKPDLVVLGFVYADDYRGLVSFRFGRSKPRYELINGHLHLMNVPVPTMAKIRSDEFFKPKLLDLLSILYYKFLPPSYLKKQRDQLTSATLDEMIRTVQDMGTDIVLVDIYTPLEMANLHQHEPKEGEKFFLNYCRKHKVPYILTRPYFEKAINEGVTLTKNVHWDKVGNAIIAEAIKEYETQK